MLAHMKLVSAIARRCPPRLREEWLVCKDDEEQKQEERVSYVGQWCIYVG